MKQYGALKNFQLTNVLGGMTKYVTFPIFYTSRMKFQDKYNLSNGGTQSLTEKLHLHKPIVTPVIIYVFYNKHTSLQLKVKVLNFFSQYGTTQPTSTQQIALILYIIL
jgi:IS4 transposase